MPAAPSLPPQPGERGRAPTIPAVGAGFEVSASSLPAPKVPEGAGSPPRKRPRATVESPG